MNVVIDSHNVRAVVEKLIAYGVKPATMRLTTASNADLVWVCDRLTQVGWYNVKILYVV